MTIPEKKWLWFGEAGHFIASSSCNHRLHTRVGMYRISTVGDYHPPGSTAAVEVGFHRLFETYVFRISGECSCGCQQENVDDWCEIDSLDASTTGEADRNHLKMCRKFASLDAPSKEKK